MSTSGKSSPRKPPRTSTAEPSSNRSAVPAPPATTRKRGAPILPPPTGPPRRQWTAPAAPASAAALKSSSTTFHMGPWRRAVSPSSLARHTPTACVRVSSSTRTTLRRKPPFSEKRSWSRATSRHPARRASHMSRARGGASANGALHTLHVVARAAPPWGRWPVPRGIEGRAPALSRPICRCHRRRHPAWTCVISQWSASVPCLCSSPSTPSSRCSYRDNSDLIPHRRGPTSASRRSYRARRAPPGAVFRSGARGRPARRSRRSRCGTSPAAPRRSTRPPLLSPPALVVVAPQK